MPTKPCLCRDKSWTLKACLTPDPCGAWLPHFGFSPNGCRVSHRRRRKVRKNELAQSDSSLRSTNEALPSQCCSSTSFQNPTQCAIRAWEERGDWYAQAARSLEW